MLLIVSGMHDKFVNELYNLMISELQTFQTYEQLFPKGFVTLRFCCTRQKNNTLEILEEINFLSLFLPLFVFVFLRQ